MDPGSGKLVLAELTDEHVHDTCYLETALKRSNGKKGKMLIDGIADSRRCYELAGRFNKTLLTPPKKGAVFRKEEVLQGRNDAIRIIRGLGDDRIARSIWAKLTGYNRLCFSGEHDVSLETCAWRFFEKSLRTKAKS